MTHTAIQPSSQAVLRVGHPSTFFDPHFTQTTHVFDPLFTPMLITHQNMLQLCDLWVISPERMTHKLLSSKWLFLYPQNGSDFANAVSSKYATGATVLKSKETEQTT